MPETAKEEIKKQPNNDVRVINHPVLEPKHINANARVYANRISMLEALPIRKNGVIGEVGVAFGYLSEFLLNYFQPQQFMAFDTFGLHTVEIIWGRPTKELLQNKTHLDFFRDKFAKYPSLVIESGLSEECLAKYPDETFDFLYIDGDHRYEGVKKDADLAKRKIRRDGVLVFNDYIMWDHFSNAAYGIVPVVNELVVNEGWQVIGFAFHHNMFCDIAIARP